jgi:hypothetical protein
LLLFQEQIRFFDLSDLTVEVFVLKESQIGDVQDLVPDLLARSACGVELTCNEVKDGCWN